MQQASKVKAFGKHLRNLRIARGIALEKVAYEGDDLTKATISRIENGLVDPKLSTLIKIADSLDIALHDLMKY
jgi:transcriptional regulator with XRE-family HTH domain